MFGVTGYVEMRRKSLCRSAQQMQALLLAVIPNRHCTGMSTPWWAWDNTWWLLAWYTQLYAHSQHLFWSWVISSQFGAWRKCETTSAGKFHLVIPRDNCISYVRAPQSGKWGLGFILHVRHTKDCRPEHGDWKLDAQAYAVEEKPARNGRLNCLFLL